LLDLIIFAVRDHLPALAGPGSTTGGVGFPHGVTTLDVVMGLCSAFLYVVIAAGYARTSPSGEPPVPWLGAAFLVAAFAPLHYVLVPVIFSDVVSSGDVVRVIASAILFFGLAMEVRRRWAFERDRATLLSGAHEASQTRVGELQHIDDERTELWRLLTHDLMHSVAVLRTYALTLTRRWPDLDEGLRLEVVAWIERESSRLRDMAERTIAVMQIETGQQLSESRRRAVDLVREVADATDELGGRLKVQVEAGAENAFVNCDAPRVLQVLRNLLNNADKYSRDGTPIELQVELADGEVVFTVRDQGPGITAEDQTKLFRRFSRLDTATTAQVPGSGLGLYLCRKTVEAHGGRIWVKSAAGEGSAFSFALPRTEDDG